MSKTVSHEEIIHCLRKFADELESCDPRNRPDFYGVGGYQEKLFLDDFRLSIRAEVKGFE